MFGHKNDNQTTVGAATVQNPSMLDNVSANDFSGNDDGATNDIQQKVQEALTEHELRKMDASDPAQSAPAATPNPVTSAPPVATASPFMASPSATPGVTPVTEPAKVESESSEPELAITDPDPTTPTEEPASDAPDDEIPHPLSSQDYTDSTDQAVSVPTTEEVAASPSAPVSPPSEAASDGNPAVDTGAAPADDSASTDSSDDNASDASKDDPGDESIDDNSNSDTPALPSVADDDAGDSSDADFDSDEDEKPSSDDTEGESSMPGVDTDKLADMKQQALDHLEPLADHLDQTPEEEFKTTMMRIQGNDNHTLLDKALKAAKNISDDKARAQAMLDIVNEVNYFSQISTDK